MAGVAIAALPAYTPVSPTPAVILALVDPADLTASPQGTTKRMTVSQLFNAPTFAGTVTLGSNLIIGTFSGALGPASAGQLSFQPAAGVLLQARAGTTSDFTLYNAAGNASILTVPTGTNNVVFANNVTVGNILTVSNQFNVAGSTSMGTVVGSGLTLGGAGASLNFFSAGVAGTRQTVTGAKGGNAALASLLAALVAYGLVIDSSAA